MTDWAVITTLNEQASMSLLVAALRESGIEVLVVDDGSEDNTIYEARNAGAHVIAHTLRTGIGPSLVEGWRRVLQEKPEHVVQLDAGGSHDPEHIAHLVHRLRWAEVVVGSRFVNGAIYEGNVKRAALSRLAATACNVKQFHAITGISDWTSGYRAFRPDALRRLARVNYTATMHGWQIEVLCAALRMGMRIDEAPIYYTAGRSSFNRRVAREAFGVWRRMGASAQASMRPASSEKGNGLWK
jgi:dolichol-phosphate mannosyltransferase